ncbi:MAG: alpha-1,2-fucosyltransferase, partial [Sphingobacteriaceae bacterium]
NTIRSDFNFPNLTSDTNIKLLTRIQNTDSVSIHIRRGDYLSSAIHLPTSLSYYEKAIAVINSKVTKPDFFIFSDDIEWCKSQLNIQNATYINHNIGKQSFIDMQLMSNCKHNIIANSSFSWWGAWLNKNERKITISPEIWLEKINIRAENIVPDSYIKL